MKTLHLEAGDISSGATRGSYWLHCVLIELEVDSFLLTNGRPATDNKNVDTLASTKLQKNKFIVLPRLGS